MSNVLFWQIRWACIYYTKLIHLPTVSWCLMTSIPVYDSLCSAGNVRFLGINGAAAIDAPLKMLSRALLENMLSDHKVLPLMRLYPNHLHMLWFKLKSPYLLRNRFSLGLLVKHSFYFPHLPRTLSKTILEDLNTAKFINLSHFL